MCSTLFPRLKEREQQKAGTMSGGEQQMLAIGRALMARPKLLMLDEPSMGIAPILVQRIYETIGEINRQGVAILLVEQNANYALDVAKRGYVLETGQRGAGERLGSAARRSRSAEGVPGDMTIYRIDRREGALPPVRVAAVRGHRVVADRAQGLRRARRAGLRADPVGDRAADRAAAAGAPGLEVEGRGLAAAAAPVYELARAHPGAGTRPILAGVSSSHSSKNVPTTSSSWSIESAAYSTGWYLVMSYS